MSAKHEGELGLTDVAEVIVLEDSCLRSSSRPRAHCLIIQMACLETSYQD